MEVLHAGHEYRLAHIAAKPGDPPPLYVTGDSWSRLLFVQRETEPHQHGTTNQEVLRVLIDRMKYVNRKLPHELNDKIIYHLRMALILHEARALHRKMEKGTLIPETMPVGSDGHFIFEEGF